MSAARPAIFLDRDGTIVEHVHYLHDPAQVRLLPGVADALCSLQKHGFALVLVTNQSGIGRGMFTEADHLRVHEELCWQLAACGARIDGHYWCPVAPPEGPVDRTAVAHPDRKPAPGMLIRAARELNLDLPQSWMIGDMVSDILAGKSAGCRGTVLVRTGLTKAKPAEEALADHVADDLASAARYVLNVK